LPTTQSAHKTTLKIVKEELETKNKTDKTIHPGSREAEAFSTLDATVPPNQNNEICRGPDEYARQYDIGKSNAR
jgi:hypothetical protein